MNTVLPSGHDPAALTAALRAQAAGHSPTEAAIELLISHEYWLTRSVFVDEFVSVETDPDLVGDTPMAFIAWDQALAALDARQLICSSSDAKILRIAASLAARIPVDLAEAVSGLGNVLLVLVLRTVAAAAGRSLEEVKLA